MKNFAIIGAAGYIAPRHFDAIRATGNRLVAAVDPHDSVGLLDSYFPDCSFFTEIERFDRHLEKLRRMGESEKVDYVTICSPNYLHDAHARLALRVKAHAICEKPLVANSWNLDGLAQIEQESGQRVYTVLQLRVHPALIALRKRLLETPRDQKFEVDLTYVTRRGTWYLYSWKGDEEKSGGIVQNIGIHFFDLLMWYFGGVERSEVHLLGRKRASGCLELERARVCWFLSVDGDDLPCEVLEQGKTAYRSITIDGEEVEFSNVFRDLHTTVYEDILAGGGFGIEDARPSIELTWGIRTSTPEIGVLPRHPFVTNASY
jgi:UDP-N-acetyl-2-amino-2-deoxyglucuronate dehydrogenase